MTGTNGGSAFVLVYLACIVGIGLPCSWPKSCSVAAARKPGRHHAPLAREARVSPMVAGRRFHRHFRCAVHPSFYSVVAGWILRLPVLAARGFGQFVKEDFGLLFAGLLANPVVDRLA